MILEELGLRPIINARGTFTVLGGSILSDEVMSAIEETRNVYLDMDALNIKAGELIARMIGVEAAFVSSGAEAGLVLSIAACLTRGDTQKMGRLPDTRGWRNEIIVQKIQRNLYEYGLEIAGAKIREVGTDERTTSSDLSEAIGDNTAAVAYFAFDPQPGVLPIEDVVRIAHQKGVPIVVDAAGELPPPEKLRKYWKAGADLSVFSGGKDLAGPNDTGLVLGSKDLVSVCRRLGPHTYETVDSKLRVYFGRPMKTSKEDIVAAVAAVRRYLSLDQQERMRKWEEKANYMARELSNSYSSLDVKVVHANRPRPSEIPKVQLTPGKMGLTCAGLQDELKQADPSIYTYASGDYLIINPHCLKDGEEKIIVESLSKILSNR